MPLSPSIIPKMVTIESKIAFIVKGAEGLIESNAGPPITLKRVPQTTKAKPFTSIMAPLICFGRRFMNKEFTSVNCKADKMTVPAIRQKQKRERGVSTYLNDYVTNALRPKTSGMVQLLSQLSAIHPEPSSATADTGKTKAEAREKTFLVSLSSCKTPDCTKLSIHIMRYAPYIKIMQCETPAPRRQ